MALNRKRRAAIKDIYPSCKISNTCPEDVINKVEHNTLADKILKYGSAGVFFGNLGISTGRGTGGTLGYIPLGGGGSRVGSSSGAAIRPNIPVSTLGPPDIIPVDAINPLGPSVIAPPTFPEAIEPLPTIPPPRFPTAIEDTLDPSVLNPVLPDAQGEIFELGEIPRVTVPTQPPDTVTTSDSAILEVTTDPFVPHATSTTQYTNPAFEVHVASNTPGESSHNVSINVRVASGQDVGESIPLHVFRETDSNLEIVRNNEFSTSTPLTPRVRSRPGLYSKGYSQVRVPEEAVPDFIARPRRVVTFENPAFEENPDITQLFNQDIEMLENQAPYLEFRDTVSLSRPKYNRRANHIRFSRLGSKATTKTRSGLVIGPKSHFYTDLSSIQPIDSMEMTVLSETSADRAIIGNLTDFDVIDLADAHIDTSEAALLEDDASSFSNLQLVIGRSRFPQDVSIPNLKSPAFVNKPYVIADLETGDVVTYPEQEISIVPSSTPATVIIPVDISQDYYLHPSLKVKKRRKILSPVFITDGSLATRAE